MSQSKNAAQTHTQFGCFFFIQLTDCAYMIIWTISFLCGTWIPNERFSLSFIYTCILYTNKIGWLAGWLVRYRKSHFRNWPPQVFYFSTLPSWMRCMWFTSFFMCCCFFCVGFGLVKFFIFLFCFWSVSRTTENINVSRMFIIFNFGATKTPKTHINWF